MTDPTAPDTTSEPLLTASRVEDVFARTEEVRAADFPDIPAELLTEVLAAERDNPEDRGAAARAVGRVIDTYLATTPAGPNEKDST